MSAEVCMISKIKATIPLGETMLVKTVAEKLKVSMKCVIEEVEGSYDGLDLLVGIRTNSGHGSLPRNKWEIEHYQA